MLWLELAAVDKFSAESLLVLRFQSVAWRVLCHQEDVSQLRRVKEAGQIDK